MGIEDGIGVGGVFLQADHLADELLAQRLLEAEPGFVLAGARVAQDLPARNVDVGGEGHEANGAMGQLHAVRALVEREAPLQRRGFGVGVHARCRLDVLGVDAADLARLLGRHLGHALGQLLEAVAPVLHEVVVVEVFLDDGVQHGHAQRRVSAGAHAQVVVGARRKPRDARIHHDEARAAAHHVDDRMAEETVRVGRERRLSPDHDAFRIHESRVFEAAGQSAGIVDLGIGTAQVVGGSRHARHVAGVARLGVAHVGRAQHVGAVRTQRAALAAGAHEEHDAFVAVFGRDAAVVLLYDVERLVPRALLPLVGLPAVFRVALHGMDDAAGIVHVVFEREAAHAQAALGDLLVFVTLYLHELAFVIDVEFQATPHRMASRRRPRGRAGDSAAVLHVAPRLAQVVGCA